MTFPPNPVTRWSIGSEPDGIAGNAAWTSIGHRLPSVDSPFLDPHIMKDAEEIERHVSRDSGRSEISRIDEAIDQPGLLDLPDMRFPELYVWLLFVSSLDIMLTWVILRDGGSEVNPVARLVIDAWGLNGAILFKFGLILFVIVACEVSARTRPHVALLLIWFGVLISSFPPVWSVTLLVMHAGSEG